MRGSDSLIAVFLSQEAKSQTLTVVIWQILVGRPSALMLSFVVQGLVSAADAALRDLCSMQEWRIEGLSWDAKECGTDRVSILRENIWVPDVHITEL